MRCFLDARFNVKLIGVDLAQPERFRCRRHGTKGAKSSCRFLARREAAKARCWEGSIVQQAFWWRKRQKEGQGVGGPEPGAAAVVLELGGAAAADGDALAAGAPPTRASIVAPGTAFGGILTL